MLRKRKELRSPRSLLWLNGVKQSDSTRWDTRGKDHPNESSPFSSHLADTAVKSTSLLIRFNRFWTPKKKKSWWLCKTLPHYLLWSAFRMETFLSSWSAQSSIFSGWPKPLWPQSHAELPAEMHCLTLQGASFHRSSERSFQLWNSFLSSCTLARELQPASAAFLAKRRRAEGFAVLCSVAIAPQGKLCWLILGACQNLAGAKPCRGTSLSQSPKGLLLHREQEILWHRLNREICGFSFNSSLNCPFYYFFPKSTGKGNPASFLRGSKPGCN